MTKSLHLLLLFCFHFFAECTLYSQVSILYQVAIDIGGSWGGSASSQELDIYAMWQPLNGKKWEVDRVGRGSGHNLGRSFCPSGRLCSFVTDPVTCEGYLFSRRDEDTEDTEDTEDQDQDQDQEVIVQNMADAVRNGKAMKSKFF